MHTYCVLFMVVISTNSLCARGQAAVRAGGLLAPDLGAADLRFHLG